MSAEHLDSKAWAHGLATVAQDGTMLDAWYPEPQLGAAPKTDAAFFAPKYLDESAGEDKLREVETRVIRTEVDLSLPVASTADAYLRLHLISHLLIKPNQANLEGIFAALQINAFTNRGPMQPDVYQQKLPELRRHGVQLLGLDKFPRLTDYVTPERVRIADAARVRLGAYLAPGTTVMHEGFVNFNAGTLGAVMVEGRISQGVVVGDGSDIGGGASIMGTLSGGGSHVISIGERSLLGANAGLGISLGDDCIVEAGLYLTAGSKVNLMGESGLQVVKAAELSGASGALYRRNSTTGAIEAIPRSGVGIKLNQALHD